MKKPALPAFQRHAKSQLQTALADTRIVALVGPRQSGKTTLARQLAVERKMRFVTLDDEQSRQFANDDPIGFLSGTETAVIDEIQRAPELLLSLKKSVDENPVPGRFLITGSVNLFKTSAAPDSLAGRVDTVTLLPLSQSELLNKQPSSFVETAFTNGFAQAENISQTPDLMSRVFSGGFPEVHSRASISRQQAWLRAYASSIAQRDVSDIASIDKTDEFSRLIESAAMAGGQLVNLSTLSSHLHVDNKTVDRWLHLLQQLFLLTRLRAWHTNKLKRLVKSPKLHFIDSGLLAAIQNVTPGDLASDRTRFGPLLECFVYSELAKICALCDYTTSLTHFRENETTEVDFILERTPGKIVGIEVKASATIKPRDLKGLKRLQELTGDGFQCGIVLHNGDDVQQVADKLFIMPISALWC